MRLPKKLKDKKGASLTLAVAVMLCLLIISVSVLSAASSNAVYIKNQTAHNRLLLLDNSIHENIMYSLQKDPMNTNLLSYQLVTVLYNAHDNNQELPDSLTPELSSGSINCSISLSFPEQAVNIQPAIPEIPERPAVYDDATGDLLEAGSPGSPRIPKTAAVDAKMIVTVVSAADGRTLTTKATYEYTGGVLTDDIMTNGGKWSLIKHEKTDSQD